MYSSKQAPNGITINMFRPLIAKRKSELASDQIKELFFCGHFKPGDRLPSERELSLQMKKGNIEGATKRLEEHIIFFGKEFRKLLPLQNIHFDEILKAQHLLDEITNFELCRFTQ